MKHAVVEFWGNEKQKGDGEEKKWKERARGRYVAARKDRTGKKMGKKRERD